MAELISKEEFEELMKIPGEVKGTAILDGMDFIAREEGEERAKEIDNVLTKLGYPLKDLKRFAYYPLGLLAAHLIALKRLFNYDAEKFQKIGEANAKTSLSIKFFIPSFLFAKILIKEAPKVWRKNYTVGEFKVIEADREKKFLVMRVENFELHPYHCETLKGYFAGVAKMTRGRCLLSEETKCVHRGDPYHEFLVKW